MLMGNVLMKLANNITLRLGESSDRTIRRSGRISTLLVAYPSLLRGKRGIRTMLTDRVQIRDNYKLNMRRVRVTIKSFSAILRRLGRATANLNNFHISRTSSNVFRITLMSFARVVRHIQLYIIRRLGRRFAIGYRVTIGINNFAGSVTVILKRPFRRGFLVIFFKRGIYRYTNASFLPIACS